MDHALYEINPDRSDQVLEVYATIRDRKLARVKVSFQEVKNGKRRESS